MLLQILDDGRITDSQGRTVDFKNTIIIMTSNLGSDILLENNHDAYKQIDVLLHHTFKPEFLNRIDEIITFNPLSKDVCIKIVDKMLNELLIRLKENKIHIEFTDSLKEYVIDSSFSYEFGARPIKRFISKNIETLLASKIISEEIKPLNNYVVDYENSNVIIK